MNNHAKASEAYNLLHNGIKAFSKVEQHGMRVDTDYIVSMQAKLEKEIAKEDFKFRSSDFFLKWRSSTPKTINYLSGSQLSFYLYKVLNLSAKKSTDSGGGSTDEDALMSLNIPALSHVIRIKKLKKIKDTYLEGFMKEQVDGVIHPVFNLHTVKTFRSSSDSPNFQNIPKRDEEAKKICRSALFARPGHQLMEVDYSGIEVRIAACYHKDPTMLKYIKDKSTDMHGDMAAQLFLIDNFNKDDKYHSVLRTASKNGFVFPEFYGDYYKGCAIGTAGNWGKLPTQGKWKKEQGILVSEGVTLGTHLIAQGIKSMDDYIEHVKKIEEHFWSVRFPVYRDWKEEQWDFYQRKGYVESFTGFTYKGLMAKNDVINYPVQGAAFHCLLKSLITTVKELEERDMRTRVFGQIHDAMVLDVFPEELPTVGPMLHDIMCERLVKEWRWVIVPLEIAAEVTGIDKSWAEIEKHIIKR